MATDALEAAAKSADGHRIGEWFWRFLSVVMLFAVGWAVWIFYQLNPTPLITRAAFEAAAKARATRDAHGLITPATKAPENPVPAAPAATSATPAEPAAPATTPAAEPAAPPKPEATATAAAAPAPAGKEPLVNVDKLRFSESIERPVAERPAKN